ncbi:MAG: bifunctional 3-(3-hydroxy-phenyl)propionate/3-hydroxycinnamic acid hydroxylase [bacterium]|nr:bifunctional 3-(3-hydroxy-phenyl)propionate/3-hydroxycinnamic acid hydroxylase [Gammaproteobacteria bacterium]
MQPSFDIAIIGMGPVGTCAAILFAHNGLNVVTFERDIEVYALPRAVAMDGEIVRAFQSIGLGDELNDLLQTVRPGDRAGFANSKHEWMFGQNMADSGLNGWQTLSMFDQPEVESYLRELAIEHPNITCHIGSDVSSFEDLGDQVVLHASNLASEEALTVSARYLLGCDGASSDVRRSLDISWHDLGYNKDWLVVDIILKEGHTLTQDTVQVCDPDRIATFVATKDPYRRWEFKLNPGETWEEMQTPEKIRDLLDPWTPRGTYEIRRSAVYQFHAATADRWRAGNIFIAGDAAHQTPPFLGQGMNAGMRDAINLAWKFPMVLSGLADDSLLDSYQQERIPHAQDLVEWAVAIGQLMEHLAAVELAERQGKPTPDVPPQKKSAGYGQGRGNPPLRDGVIVLDQVSDTGSSGYLFSQPLVSRDKQTFKLDEALGKGFAIVAKTDSDLELTEQSKKIVEKLDITLTSLETLTEIKGHFDNLFKSSAAAIVRPDRYVFGHTTETVTLDHLLIELSKKLSLI